MAFLLVAFPWLFRGPLLSRKTVFGPFSWLFRGPRIGQILLVIALEQSFDSLRTPRVIKDVRALGSRTSAQKRQVVLRSKQLGQSFWPRTSTSHVYLNSVQQMVSGELAGECLQTGFERHGLPLQRALLDTVYPLREHLNSVQRMVPGGYCEGLFPDTVCWTRLRNTW